ncbi:hypothetical protein [Staphylococcus pseudintermedius]|uniref:hypothetical protein n=1 Tax=Staphylococcus pseudintermedius TaxID=283734 RepID=UPI001A3322B9|nr:hypothetical protein [Staphylococcus pseudintermedius]MBJ8269009.1 hypothetical protein [Staphylococcus pseudintermedius]
MNKNMLAVLLLIGYIYLIFNFLTIEYSLTTRIFYVLNLISLSLIMLSYAKIKKMKKNIHLIDKEQLALEKSYSSLMYMLNTALIISFISFLTSFIYLREEHPQFTIYALVLLMISSYYIKLFYEDKYNIIYMNKKNVDFSNPNLEDQLQLDDGEKSLILKQLINFYRWTIILMFITEVLLMFYSVISSNHQTVSIILIAIVIFISSSSLITTKKKTNEN